MKRYKKYYYQILTRYMKFFIGQGKQVLISGSSAELMCEMLSGETRNSVIHEDQLVDRVRALQPEFVVLNGSLQFSRDIQTFLSDLASASLPTTRILIAYYSSLWRPVFKFAALMGLHESGPETNWISRTDFENFLRLSDLELVTSTSRVLLPIRIPFLSAFINRWIAPLPIFNLFCLVNVAVVRPRKTVFENCTPSVSVVVAARNESGNIPILFNSIPQMGPNDELIVVEGNSTDATWEVLNRYAKEMSNRMNVTIAQQDGKGKGDAVRKGFALASKDILMILDADLTVAPIELPKFYHAIVAGKGEFINGSRLVYPMEKKAMRFMNLLGNHFFARAFSFLLGQPLKDTLCGTKVLTKRAYEEIAANRKYFGEFDPFGDFDLIFGAARSGLQIVELPIRYRERTYGETNIQRWRHGWLLLKMVVFAARKIKFV